MIRLSLTILLLSFISLFQPDQPLPVEERYHWQELNGPWVMTYYGAGDDGYINHHHGAYWNGLQCEDPNNPGQPIPDRVTGRHLALAMPGAEWYCVPVKVCYNEQCIVAVAIDVMADYRLKKPGSEVYFSHLDVWPEMARRFEILGRGIVWGEGITVYVGAK